MGKLRLNGTLDDYRKKVSDGLAQLHNFDGKGFAITEVVEYKHPYERVLNVMLLGGRNLDSWKHTGNEKLKEFARVNRCQAIEFACRLGLVKKLKDLGYRGRRMQMRLEVDSDDRKIRTA